MNPADAVAEVLEGYAGRGVFRGFSRGPVKGGQATFRMRWHHDRFFHLKLDCARKTLKMPSVLPGVPRGMIAELRKFIDSRFSEEMPPHRRMDRRKLRISATLRGGDISLTAVVSSGDFEYASRKLIHLVQEIYLVFLNDGRYYEWMVETFDLDPDKIA